MEATCQRIQSQGKEIQRWANMQGKNAVGQLLPSQEEQAPYLPPQGCVLGEALCSQDVSMDHVLHKGEVHQVLPIPVGIQGMVPLG